MIQKVQNLLLSQEKTLYKIRQRMLTDAKKHAAVCLSLMNTTPEKEWPLVKQYNWFHKKKQGLDFLEESMKNTREKNRKERKKIKKQM